MSAYFAVTALMRDSQLKTVQLEDFQGKFVLLLFYPGDFTALAKTELLAFASDHDKFVKNDCQVEKKTTHF